MNAIVQNNLMTTTRQQRAYRRDEQADFRIRKNLQKHLKLALVCKGKEGLVHYEKAMKLQAKYGSYFTHRASRKISLKQEINNQLDLSNKRNILNKFIKGVNGIGKKLSGAFSPRKRYGNF